MKKIALPVDGNMLCKHFGQAQYFKFYDLENQMIHHEEII